MSIDASYNCFYPIAINGLNNFLQMTSFNTNIPGENTNLEKFKKFCDISQILNSAAFNINLAPLNLNNRNK